MNNFDSQVQNFFSPIIEKVSGAPNFFLELFIPRLSSPVGFLDVFIIGILFLILFFYFHDQRGFNFKKDTVLKAGMITLAGIFTYLITVFLKDFFARPRPFVYDGISPFFQYGGYDGFPSGHSAVFMALAVSTFWYHRKLGSLYLVIAVLIGVSRIVFGLHYLSDVLAGFALGAAVAIFGRLLWERLRTVSFYHNIKK